jgi:hypothetical protein
LRLPKDRLVFLVDLVPVGTFPGLGMSDFYPLGTKKDVADRIALQEYASQLVRDQARAGRCWQPAENELQLDRYKDMPNYANGRPYVVRRYCGLWGRGT